MDYSSFLCDIIPILGDEWEIFDGVTSLEVDLGPHLAKNVLKFYLNP